MPDEQHAQELPERDSRVLALLAQAAATALARRRLPESTYRLQFHAGFTFRDAAKIVPYLHDLGITDCYSSPCLKARPGSKHGYDISDHRALNPELGDQADFDSFVLALQQRDMGQILDIVPNHMGIIGNENVWWNDVLENGPCARHAGYFDIDWQPIKTELRDKVLLGVLGEPYGKVLEAGLISLTYEAGSFVIHYFEHRFPVAPKTAVPCLWHRHDELEAILGKDAPEWMEYQSILTALSHLPTRAETSAAKIEERYREKEVIKRRLAALTDSSPTVREFITQNVAVFNGKQGDPHSFDLLDQLLQEQAYRLAFWQVAADEINYRRFFDVNELAALSMEKPEVFADTHELILRLLVEEKVTGLRIDHPDGLYDPRQYFERLQQHYLLELARRGESADDRKLDFSSLTTGRNGELPLYVVAEKILGKDEYIPDDWAVYGTTGYDFLNLVNGLFVDSANEAAFNRIYQRSTGQSPEFRPYVYEKKFLILQVALAGELHVLGRQLDRLSERDRWSRDFTLNSLRHALREIIACFPVYRSYIINEVLPRDRQYVESAVRQAKRKNPAISSSLFDFVRDMLLLRYPEHADEKDRAEQRRFVGKFQQVTAPVMAKGLEDTAFYVYNRLASLNEVGGDPGRFGVAATELHAFFFDRCRHWPHALSASSTHDTKRSEDVRARLNVLSEMPRAWQQALARWKLWNKRHRTTIDSLDVPDRNDEYLLYQTLIGVWPLEGRPAIDHVFVERICQYMAKATHEAKVQSSWINPNPAYDDAVARFVRRILDPKLSGRFLDDFYAFQATISHLGLLNSLAQLLLKLTGPGAADFYQGTELWDFSLVDPDNRRPVDFERRAAMLHELQERFKPSGSNGASRDLRSLAHELLRNKEDGRVKLYVTWRGLQCRRMNPGLFTRGDYEPLATIGTYTDHVFAFMRHLEDRAAFVAVPRLLSRLIAGPVALPLGASAWHDDRLAAPGEYAGRRFQNAFTGTTHELVAHNGRAELSLAEVFADFPVALLLEETL